MPPDIHVIAELERYQVAYDWAGDDEVKIKCPFHPDEKPSCNVSVSKRVFCCHAGNCGKTGDIVTLLAKVIGHSRAVVLEELSQRYDLDDVKIVEPDVVERWHAAIWKAEPLLAELRKRAVTDAIIIKRKFGADDGRVTIPIPNARGDWVNVRKYLPGAPSDSKMRNMRGRGSARWYPEDQLKYDAIVLCGGECKSVVAAEQLNSHGVGACWVTHGEKSMTPALMKRLSGKAVTWCLDVDAAGVAATTLGARALRGTASEQMVMNLPLDVERYPKGDINDFVAAGGDMWELYQQATPWVDVAVQRLEDTEPETIHLAAAARAQYAGKRVQVTAVTTAMDTAPYVVPRDVVVKCDKSLKECAICPVWPSHDGKFVIPIESPAILEMIHAPKRSVRDALVSAVGIPATCRICSFDAETYYNAEDVRLSPQLEITDRAADQKIQPAVCIGPGLDLNEPYVLTGRMWPHPLTQQSTLLISKYSQTRDALSSYEPRELEKLRIFQPETWTTEMIQAKLDDIYDDFETCVTRIYRRRDVHLTFDLAGHSPLFLIMQGDVVKGWVETLIVGDSSQGKSECGLGLMRHYGLGERVELKNASVAGMLGGLKQMGTRWFAEWGLWPKHDKRWLILEEVKGTSVDVISKLTDMRSSGVAALTKIEKMHAHARTRTTWVSNPRGEGRRVSSYGYGVDVIRELIGGLEDVRRFDACLVVADHEVDVREINAFHVAKNGAHSRYKGELCRALILWGWTRRPDQCVIDKEVSQVILDEATRLCDLFSDAIPIIDRGSTRYKIARLAASLAVRTFSCTDDNMLALDVKPSHVLYVSRWLERIYSKPSCGYLEFTKTTRGVDSIAEPETIKRTIAAMPFPYVFIEHALRCEQIEQQDLQDWCNWDRTEASQIVSLLVRKHALKRDGRFYRKTAQFVDMLRDIQSSRGVPDRPDHIPEGEF